MRCRALVLFCVLSGSVVGAATAAQEVAEDHSLATSLVTPHKPWGRGYVRGPLKALFFIFAGHYGGEWDEPGTRLREVNELAQRFDLQADAVLFAAGPNKTWAFHGGRLGEERAAKLLETPYQLYVFGGFGLDKLPGKLQFAVLEQVAKGAGWLQCGGDAVPYLAERRKVDPAPASLVGGLPQIDGQATAALAAAYRLREGRAVWLRYPAWALTPSKPFSWRGLTDYDSWMLLVGRAALWAAGREPAVQVDRIGADGALRLPARTAQRAAIALSTRGDSTALTIAPALRRPSDGWSAALKEFSATVAPGKATELAVELPPLRADDYYLDLVVRSSRGVEAFGAGTLLVESPAGIESVSVDRKFAEAGETATATATLRGTPPAGSAIRFVLRDAHQRAIEQAEQPVRAGQAAYLHRFTPDALSTIELRVEAVLLSGGQELEKKQTALAVPKRRQGRHNFVMWDTPNDVLGWYAWQQMKAAGYEVALLGSMGGPKAAPPVLAAADVSIVPYSTRIMDEKDADGVMKPVCWNHDPTAAEYVAKIVENQRQLREHGVFVYSLGDEGTTLGCCVHPDCLVAYRRYLRSQYREIAALNASWGSSYASFDEVTLLDLKDNMENAARDKAPARWYDRQAFARDNLMQFVGRFVKSYAELDPKALTGFEGTGGFGDDFDALCGINTFYGPYPSIGDDLVRSTMAREKVRSNWMGYSKTGDALSDAAWRMVMKGMDSIWWWMWDGIGSWRGLVRPTLDFWPATEDLNAEMKPVREGLGDLVINSEVVHSGIAVFYSVASALAGQIDSAGGFSAAQPTHEAWTELTYDLGLDFRYLTAAAVRGGQLDGREFKVLLLPMSQALAPEEAAAIRAFVEAGGTVIADVRPGIYDGHCRPLEQGALDSLFGIKRGGRGKGVDAEVALTAGPGGRLNATLGKVKVDPEVAAAGAQALGQAGERPVMLVNQVGKGRAVLLNFQLPGGKGEDAAVAAAREVLAHLYTAAGARPAVALRAPDGQPVPFTETRTWQNGEGLLVGTYRKMRCAWFSPTADTLAGEPVPARLTFPAGRHVYDLRARKHLGVTGRVDTRLRWGRANFYAVLPYATGKPTVTLAGATRGGTLRATLALDVPRGSTARHAVLVEVVDPQGRAVPWGQRVVLLERGRGSAAWRVAHSDAPGRWRVQATELFSGQRGEGSYTLR